MEFRFPCPWSTANLLSECNSPHDQNSMFQLARWVQKISKEMKEGLITAHFTYAEFKKKVAEIPRQTDFSRLAKYHMKEKLKKEASTKRGADGIDDDDSDIEVLSGPGNGSTPSTQTSNSKPKKPAQSSQKRPAKKQKAAKTDIDEGEYFGWSKSALMDECAEFGLTKSGSRAALIERLKGPRPPRVWLEVSFLCCPNAIFFLASC